ncbi:hypothetical protein GF366_03600 [Candidatus Peregrinibacteria bacterium]|nr:hypothetical protein [Candidatus Peregrinibacteria bacterium]
MANLKELSGINIRECGEPLVELDRNEFVLEPLYYQWGHSDTDVMKLRSGVLEKLRSAKANLQRMPDCRKWNLKIWDCYRSLKTQENLYEDILEQFRKRYQNYSEDELHLAAIKYISPPSNDQAIPAPHNTGACVDLTIVDNKGDELPMGTGFDDFSEKAHTNFYKNSEERKTFHKNRMLLKKIMEHTGFANYPLEWWHYSLGDQEWVRQTGASYAFYGSVELNEAIQV